LDSVEISAWGWLRAAAVALSLGATVACGTAAHAGGTLEVRKLPMHFELATCEGACSGSWISAIGVVTADTPKAFEDFARNRDLAGATIVLDSSGGSVNDAIALGRRWRQLGLRTTVGATVETRTSNSISATVAPDAYCESMCVFLLLSGKTRYVPEGARVRVHQIWMGDRADDARAASYTAQDLMIVERDIGRLAKYTFDMGGTGDLLALALSVPPWEDLHQLSEAELRLTNLITTDSVADVLPHLGKAVTAPVAAMVNKPIQDRLVDTTTVTSKSTKTAEASAPAPTGGAAVQAPARPQ
jgi:hypothetical protein